jgi:hypothetical protein
MNACLIVVGRAGVVVGGWLCSYRPQLFLPPQLLLLWPLRQLQHTVILPKNCGSTIERSLKTKLKSRRAAFLKPWSSGSAPVVLLD